MTALDGETAAVKSQPLGAKASRNSRTKVANAGLSEAGPALQSTWNNYSNEFRVFFVIFLIEFHTCQHFGYSQSRSRPSNP